MEEETIECRFCFGVDKEENLVCPCKCDGTSKWVHRECLENSRNHEAIMNKCMSCLHAYEFEDNPWVVICSLFTCNDDVLNDIMVSVVAYDISEWFFDHALFEFLDPCLIYPIWGVLFDYHKIITFLVYFTFTKWMLMVVCWFFFCFAKLKKSRSVCDMLSEKGEFRVAFALLYLGITSFVFSVLYFVTQDLVQDGVNELVSRQYIKNYKRNTRRSGTQSQ
jgi:hypothetical protein